jgi:hypothetical protein
MRLDTLFIKNLSVACGTRGVLDEFLRTEDIGWRWDRRFVIA